MSTISNIIRQKNKTMGEVKMFGALVGDSYGEKTFYTWWMCCRSGELSLF